MHIIIAILSLATAVFVAYRRFNELGLSSTLNPFLFLRRRAWHKRRETNPLFLLNNNKDVVSVLLFIIAKLDGELTRESKDELVTEYTTMLHIDINEALATLRQNSFMLEQYPIVRADLKKILHKDCVAQFNCDQVIKLVKRLDVVARREGNVTTEQQQWILDIEKLLTPAQGQAF